MTQKLFTFKVLVLLLVNLALFSGIFLVTNASLVGYIFLLIYMGAVLVLVVYLYFSNTKVRPYFSILPSVFLKMFLLHWWSKTEFHPFSTDLVNSLFLSCEAWLTPMACSFILLVLFCIMSLDIFRFSSLRNVF